MKCKFLNKNIVAMPSPKQRTEEYLPYSLSSLLCCIDSF